MSSKPVNLKTRRNGKRWFVVSAYDGGEPICDFTIFAADPAPAGRLAIAAMKVNGIAWTRVRSYAYTDPSLDWEERA